MTEPRVTIVMATRNRAHLMGRSIESVLRQTFSNWEFIIVDDASDTDEVQKCVEGYAGEDGRIRYMRNEKNQGISVSTNRAIQAARGEYIAIIDDDDWWLPNDKLERQVAFLDEHAEHVAVGGGLVVVDKDGNERYRYLKPETDDAIRAKMLFANPMAHTTTVYRKSAAEAVGLYNTESPYAGDRAFFLKLGQIGKLYNLPDYLAYYTLADQNTITNKQREHLKAVLMYTKKYHDGYPRYGAALLFNYAQVMYAHLPGWLRRVLNAPLLLLKRTFFDRVGSEQGVIHEVSDKTRFHAMPEQPLVSVIMATYNRSDFVSDAIQSVLEQDYPQLELIVIDDASTDDTARVLDDYRSDDRVQVLRNEPNQGLAASHNRGLSAARGTYIAILDDDDQWQLRDKLQKQVEFLESNRDYVIVGGGVVVVDEDGHERYRYLKPQEDAEIRAGMLYANPFAHSTVLYRRDLAHELGGYDEAFRGHAADRGLFMRLGKRGKMHNLPLYMTRYLLSDSNMLVRHQRKQLRASAHYMHAHHKGYPHYFSAALLHALVMIYAHFPDELRRVMTPKLIYVKRRLFDRVS